jgi:hypothetical protein
MAKLRFLKRPWVARLLVLAGLGACYIAQDALFGGTRDLSAVPRPFTFRLPLPAAFAAEHGVSPHPDIERVVLTGFFADWNPDAPQGRMQPAGEGRWAVSLTLPPGDNQYKFVLYLRGRAQPL